MRTRTMVSGILLDSAGGISRIDTYHGSIFIPLVVNAAGIWVPYIGKMVNFLIGSSRQFADMDTTVDVHLLKPMESGFL